jgi:hypothetical protein
MFLFYTHSLPQKMSKVFKADILLGKSQQQEQ